jgi:hypothetical protein
MQAAGRQWVVATRRAALRPADRGGENLDTVDENANLGTPPLNAAASTVASAASPLQKKDAKGSGGESADEEDDKRI